MHQSFSDTQEQAPSSQQLEQLFDSYINNDQQQIKKQLEQIGDLENCLNTDKSNGIINQAQIEQNLQKYGSNAPESLDQVSLTREIILQFKSSQITLAILIALSDFAFQLINKDNMYYSYAWIEGFFVFICLTVSSIYQSYKTYLKNKEFNMLKQYRRQNKTVKVLRFGQDQWIQNSDLTVGDILYIQEGQQLSVDGILLEAKGILIDESAVTGDCDGVQKIPLKAYLENSQYSQNSPILISGSYVISGEGKMMVLVVGKRSLKGKIDSVLANDSETEYSQANIGLSQIINGKFNFIIRLAISIAAINFILKNLRFQNFNFLSFCTCISHMLLYLIFIFSLGNPIELISLQKSIVLAKLAKTLLMENNLVRKLSSIEKLAKVNYICTEKTGVLTRNELGVVSHYSDQDINTKENKQINEFWKIISRCCFLTCGGSNLDKAIKDYIQTIIFDPNEIMAGIEIIKEIPFTSMRKRKSTICKFNNQILLFTKGPFEIMLPQFKSYLTQEAEIRPLDSQIRLQLEEAADKMNQCNQRVICIALRIMNDVNELGEVNSRNLYPAETDNQFVFLSIFGIRDLLRREIPNGIKLCQNAGVNVIMMTGDNKLTANYVGQEINLFNSAEHISLEGPEFSEIVRSGQFTQIYKNLRVIARSRPQDKLDLINQLQMQGNVVAVTGSGTNDAPSIKQADIGYALGISSTDVAREASDIILLDDNFFSTIKGILLGRNFYEIIKKLIKAQLTNSLALLGILLIGAILYGQWVFNIFQIIYIYLGCGLYQSFLLANEMPNMSELCKLSPIKNNEALLSSKQIKQILCSTLFVIVTLGFLLCYSECLPEYQDSYDSTYFKNRLQYKYSDAICYMQDNDLICKCDYENDCKRMASGRFYTLTGQEDYLKFWQIDHINSRHFTILFNVYVVFIIVNTFNCRITNGQFNVFKGLEHNLRIIYGIMLWIIIQATIVTIGSRIFSSYNNYGLTIKQQLLSYGIGSTILVVEALIKIIIK